jgi:hypothetical protein
MGSMVLATSRPGAPPAASSGQAMAMSTRPLRLRCEPIPRRDQVARTPIPYGGHEPCEAFENHQDANDEEQGQHGRQQVKHHGPMDPPTEGVASMRIAIDVRAQRGRSEMRGDAIHGQHSRLMRPQVIWTPPGILNTIAPMSDPGTRG